MSDLLITAGYFVQGTFNAIDPSTYFGYFYGVFYSHDCGLDFSQTPGARPVLWTEAKGYEHLPLTATFAFRFNGTVYNSRQEAEAKKAEYDRQRAAMFYQMQTFQGGLFHYHEGQSVSYPSRQLPQQEGPYDLSYPPYGEKQYPQVQEPVAAPKAPSFPVKTVLKKVCSICREPKPVYTTIFNNTCCDTCIFTKYQKNELSSEAQREGVRVWTENIMVQVHNFLSECLPEDLKRELPSEIKLPLNHFVCVGRNAPVAPGYPPKGHIVGLLNKCMEEGCPNHDLCKTCAAKTTNCPECGSFVQYEEFPTDCPQDCMGCHKYSFTEPCAKCKRVEPRKKRWPE